jgi:hypothetical protein
MRKTLVIIGGGINLILAVFHGYLGWKNHRVRTPGQGLDPYPRQAVGNGPGGIHGFTELSPDHRALMEMLNVGTLLFALFVALSSLLFLHDLLTTRLGTLTFLFAFLLLTGRAAGEIVFFPTFNAVIFTVCLLVAALYGVALAKGPSAGKKASV